MITKKFVCVGVFLVLTMFCNDLFSKSADDIFNEYSYCSAYTENGNWELMWGPDAVQMYCILIQHKLGATYSHIVDMRSGSYDPYDLIRVTANCVDENDEEVSFELIDHGFYVLRKAYNKAKNLKLQKCLFDIKNWME